jgi:acyl CoA:acetate/3-ketoacid CoA transferase beta subunit
VCKHVFIIMGRQRGGEPRLVAQCALPVTARGVFKLVATNYGLFSRPATGSHRGRTDTLDELRATVGAHCR